MHQLRSQEHAILVGTKTALTDNPSLTTREIVGKNPVRILIDFDLKVPRNARIYNEDAPSLIFNSEKDSVFYISIYCGHGDCNSGNRPLQSRRT